MKTKEPVYSDWICERCGFEYHSPKSHGPIPSAFHFCRKGTFTYVFLVPVR